MIAVLLAATLTAQAPQSVYIEELTSPEIRAAIAAGKTTAIIYTGSTEQNGPHMVTGKHNFIAHWVAGQIADSLGDALVYPTLPFAPTGDLSPPTGHMRFPGSVTISDQLFGDVAAAVARSAIAAGFKTVLLMGDHGSGQDALARAAAALDSAWRPRGVRVLFVGDVYAKARDQARAYLAAHHIEPGEHAGPDDTSELWAIDSTHRWIRADRRVPGDSQNGVSGDPRQASPEMGRIFLGYKISAAVAEIRRLRGR
jgi:creatinine amidohydrolase/Fe(II)-dependent formamide hydrolase-like protein